MADNKKGFMLYADLIHTIEKMPDEKAGQLFKTVLEYVNDTTHKPDPDTVLYAAMLIGNFELFHTRAKH